MKKIGLLEFSYQKNKDFVCFMLGVIVGMKTTSSWLVIIIAFVVVSIKIALYWPKCPECGGRGLCISCEGTGNIKADT